MTRVERRLLILNIRWWLSMPLAVSVLILATVCVLLDRIGTQLGQWTNWVQGE